MNVSKKTKMTSMQVITMMRKITTHMIMFLMGYIVPQIRAKIVRAAVRVKYQTTWQVALKSIRVEKTIMLAES